MQLKTDTYVLSKSQILQKQINEFLYPDKQDRLKIGCQIIGKYDGLITLSRNAERVEQSDFYHCYGFDLEIGCPRGVKGNELLEVLGKPIWFSDLLLFISNIKDFEITNCGFIDVTKELSLTIEYLFGKTILNIEWDCTKDFHNQNEIFYKSLNKLIEINNSNL
jgi:hypothetical protein